MARTPVQAPPTTPTKKMLREQLERRELELALAETEYMTKFLQGITTQTESQVVDNEDDGKWDVLASGGRLLGDKDLTAVGVVTDMTVLRRQSYRAWRLNPHARGILRNYVKYIIGRNLTLDFSDVQRGAWVDPERTKLRITTSEDDQLAVRLVWDDFVKRNQFSQRAKEIVLRCFRDGEVFVRRFRTGTGRLQLRFIEPAHVQSPSANGTVQPEYVKDRPELDELVGKPTLINAGIEFLASDIETVVAYHVQNPGTSTSTPIPAGDVVHRKMADMNDLRGFPWLEPILKHLTNYAQWEEYRVVLNKVRTAVALVRKIEGTPAQAASIIAGRQPVPGAPAGREPQTTAARRETMWRPGTTLNPGPGVSYEFIAPKLEARDAGEDGRRILLSAAAGAGQPEMLITGDYSNSNFASTKEAMQAVQREWEDWQDFFEPVFLQIVDWVMQEAIQGLGLPEDTDTEVTIQWPTIMKEDEEKTTNRRATLHSAAILSRRTWAALEELDYDEELENMRVDGEEAERQAALGALAGADADEDDASADADGGDNQPPAKKPTPTTKQESRARRAHKALVALAALEEAADRHPDDAATQAIKQYVSAARDVILA